MASKICMNSSCATNATPEWKKGWHLRSGGFADLCYKCGSAYENLVFCDTFHLAESGWRPCNLCSKNLHCGCIVSESLLELLDYGGVGCSRCAKNYRLHSFQANGICNGFGSSKLNNDGDQQPNVIENKVGGNVDEGKLAQLCTLMEATDPNLMPQIQISGTKAFFGRINGEEVICSNGESGAGFPKQIQPSTGSTSYVTRENGRLMLDVKDMRESVAHPSLNITLGTPSGPPNFVPPFSSGIIERREQSKSPSPLQHGQNSQPIFPKPPITGHALSSETNKGVVSQTRVARPPADGRGKSQLLPRYWPRITDQELQQISGELNSSIVPLFEKVLSASDAGRIGRLVLPKACAEAYFPHISQSEGLPLRIQDVKGKEWTFQFRFWPNNNSRMYVLEGVTPCIQSMQLQAGDTVTFSRIAPGGKLVIGCRKASSCVQDLNSSSLPNDRLSEEDSFLGVIENPALSGYSSLFQTLKGTKDPHLNSLSENLNLADGDVSWHKSDNHGGRKTEDPMQQMVMIPEKKKTRNIGSKSKRLLMHNEDVMELRLTWEEAQDLLRPPPSVKPSIVTIDDLEFEEYDEPPVFGKKTIFTSHPSGGQEQWVQCDDCSKWRRLPVDILLPSKWTCSDNVWDPSRCSCSVPEELSPKKLDNLLRAGKDFKKRRHGESHTIVQEREPSGLDALASAAVLGENIGDTGDPSVGVTTKHPRHRPGCTCIVCIQPPSGKGRHKPTCTCNVCMTVKRRFKTLMLRKKKRLSEREVGNSQEQNRHHKDESEISGAAKDALFQMSSLEKEKEESQSRAAEVACTGEIDLNCDPNREDMQVEVQGTGMIDLVQAARFPLENYMKQNGLTSLSEKHSSPSSSMAPETARESEKYMPDEGRIPSIVWESEGRGDEGQMLF